MTKRTAKRIANLVNLFEQHNPTTCLEAERKCGIRLVPLPGATGAYKDVYFVKGYPLVIKFPKTDNVKMKRHSTAEIRTVRKILSSKRKYAVLHEYMPKIYYGNVRTGVIIMQRYTTYSYRKYNNDRHVISQLIRQLCDSVWEGHKLGGEGTADVGTCNIAKKENGYPVIIDLGYFLPEGQDGADYI